MQKIKCFILDDEFYSRNILKDNIAKVPFLELAGEEEDPVLAYQRIQELSVDLLFLDIHMPNISGLAFLEHHSNLPLTIITTAHPEHALETFKFKVIDYLLKPIGFEEFYRAVTKAQEYLNTQNRTEGEAKYFFVKTGTIFSKVVFDELIFAEAKDNYVMLHTKHQNIMVYMTFKDISEYLAGKEFVRVHKSYIVNIAHIDNIDNDNVKAGGEDIPVSRMYRNDLIQAIQGKILKKL